jgi:hypothetical protein
MALLGILLLVGFGAYIVTGSGDGDVTENARQLPSHGGRVLPSENGDDPAMSSLQQEAQPQRVAVVEGGDQIALGWTTIEAQAGGVPVPSFLMLLGSVAQPGQDGLAETAAHRVRTPAEADYVIYAPNQAFHRISKGDILDVPRHVVHLEGARRLRVEMVGVDPAVLGEFHCMLSIVPVLSEGQKLMQRAVDATCPTLRVVSLLTDVMRPVAYGGVARILVMSAAGSPLGQFRDVAFSATDDVVVIDCGPYRDMFQRRKVVVDLDFVRIEPNGEMTLELRPSPMDTLLRRKFERLASETSKRLILESVALGDHEVVLTRRGCMAAMLGKLHVGEGEMSVRFNVVADSRVDVRILGATNQGSSSIVIYDYLGRREKTVVVEGDGVGECAIAGVPPGCYYFVGASADLRSVPKRVVVGASDRHVVDLDLRESGVLIVPHDGDGLWTDLAMRYGDGSEMRLLKHRNQEVRLAAGDWSITVGGRAQEVTVPAGGRVALGR